VQLEQQLEEEKRVRRQRLQDTELENTRLEKDLSQLRAEMEVVMKELQVMTDDKLSVEREIDVYRQLLDENQPAQTTGDVPPAYFVPTYCTPIGYMPKFILFYHISPKY